MQPKLVVYHQNLQVLRLHTWRLSLKALDMPDPRRTWLKELHVANSDSLPQMCTTCGGFCTWCSARRLSSWHASVQQIAEFLNDLFEKGELKVRMIERYKSATLGQRGVNVGTNPYVCRLVISFYTDRPVEVNLVPKVGLDYCSRRLNQVAFRIAGYGFCELKLLTFKTVFLLSLASRARWGKIHALDRTS